MFKSIGKTYSRLNKKGKQLFATKYFLEGQNENNIIKALDINSTKQFSTCISGGCGFLGLYVGENSDKKGLEILDSLSDDELIQLLIKTEMIIAKKGSDLFTKTKVKRS